MYPAFVQVRGFLKEKLTILLNKTSMNQITNLSNIQHNQDVLI